MENAADQARHAGQRLHHFHGGLRLRHNKRVSCQVPLQRTPIPPRLAIPLLQHAGEEGEAMVVPGQAVLKGEVIGRYNSPSEGLVHAPTSGTITAIARQPIAHPSGMDGKCILLKPDGLDRWATLHPLTDWENTEAEVLRQRIRECGIVGLGGAVFPTGLKVDKAQKSAVHTLILNGAECEPYISCDEMLMREKPEQVVLGARIMQKAVEAEQTIIAIEDQMGAVFQALQNAIDEAGCKRIKLVKVTTIYPEGGEKQLIQVLTGLEVPGGGRPGDLGLLCQNVATAAAVASAVTEGKPLIERIVTVTGKGVKEPRNLVALLGTALSILVDQCGGYTQDAARLVVGGPMMGYALASDQNPVVKATNCVLIPVESDIRPAQAEMPCINCGECARVCPALLLPQSLHWQIRNNLLDEAADYGLDECIECGCCDFVCPSHIPLVEWFRFGKSGIAKLTRERESAELARQRFEAREERLERIKRERRERMELKKKALLSDAEKKKKIAETLNRARNRDAGTDPDPGASSE